MSDLRAVVGQPFEAPFGARETGLVGTVAYRIDDMDGNTVVGPTTAGIIELGTSGYYRAKPNAPGTVDTWLVIWSKDGSFDPTTNAADVLTTVASEAELETPDLPSVDADTQGFVGPCQAWTTSDAVAECCGDESDSSIYDDVVVAASQTLYALVPRFPGVCGPIRVRPCVSGRCGVYWDLPVQWTGMSWSLLSPPTEPRTRNQGCGCSPIDSVPLAGYVQEVLEVTLDGSIVPADQYRLDFGRRRLERLYDADGDAAFWPSCQDDRAEHTEAGTFSVLYTYGVPPPVIGQKAAAELACAIYQTCAGGNGASAQANCPLPTGVVKVVRQGITIELSGFRSFGYNQKEKRWFTGLPLVDQFLNAFNPRGRRKRRATILSPDVPRYPRIAGIESSS